MKDTVELRKMSIPELEQELLAMRKTQFEMRMKKANGTLDKTHTIGMVRKTIARIKTLMTEMGGQ